VNIKHHEIEDPGFSELFPPERTLLRDDLGDEVDTEAFSQRVWSMMQVNFPHTLTMPQQDRMRWHLFPSFGSHRSRSRWGSMRPRPTRLAGLSFACTT
jgi:hypothetical protein